MDGDGNLIAIIFVPSGYNAIDYIVKMHVIYGVEKCLQKYIK